MTEKMLRAIRELVRPLKTKIANSIAAAVIENVDDSKKLQILQITTLDGTTIGDCQRFQEFGFTSVPLEGAEAVVVFPNGDQGNPFVIGVEDRRYRPTDWTAGEAGTFNAFSAMMRHKADGTTEITGGGAALALATKADIDALASHVDTHTHADPVTGFTTTPADIGGPQVSPSAAGTDKLKGE